MPSWGPMAQASLRFLMFSQAAQVMKLLKGGAALWKRRDLLDLEPEERAAAGVFLAFQYPVEIPGLGSMTFLRTA